MDKEQYIAIINEWIAKNKTELMLYPNHYLMIIPTKGIMAAAETQALLLKKLGELSKDMTQFSKEDLDQTCYMIYTKGMDTGKRGQA